MIVPGQARMWLMVRYVEVPLLALFAWDCAVVVANKQLHWHWFGSTNIPLALYGSVIGLLIGFRNNSAYARWWEGRQLWGQIVNSSRSLARKITAAPQPMDAADPTEHADLLRLQVSVVHQQIAYVHALRQFLRELPPWDDLVRLLPATEVETLRHEKNIPLALQQRIGQTLRECRDRGWVDSIGWQTLDGELDHLGSAQGGTERIKNTPLPKQYDFFPRLFVGIYCLVLPIGMVGNLGWYTPLGSTLVGFMFLALEKIGRDLENPFDNTVYDVPMTAICRTIEINLRQLLGEREYPAPEQSVRGVLW